MEKPNKQTTVVQKHNNKLKKKEAGKLSERNGRECVLPGEEIQNSPKRATNLMRS